MIPILYESTERSFTSNGLGRLYECTECTVTEERNGIYECDFVYPVDGLNFKKIYPGRIIGVEHDYNGDVQPFEIVSVGKPINGRVSFHAVHISYRLGKVVASGTNVGNIDEALTLVRSGAPENVFTYSTDMTGATGYMAAADGVPHSVRSLLGGMEGSMLDTYGGEYLFDRFSVQLLSARGQVKPITIRYGVNLVDYNEDIDYSESYTSVVPYWIGQDETTGTDIVVKGARVDSGMASYNGRNMCVPLDLTDKFETKPTAAQLETMARQYADGSLPNRNIQIDFVNLADTEEYAQYKHLMRCGLCDSVRVVFPKYDVEGTFKIVKTVWNVLLEKYDEMELGNLQTSLAQALGITADSAFVSRGGGGSTASINGVDLVGNKTSLQIGVVDMIEPYLDMSEQTVSGTVDYEIYQALVSLGWDGDVIVTT